MVILKVMRTALNYLSILLIAMLFAPAIHAQNYLGGIKGRITGNLLPVEGAEVVLMRGNNVIDKTKTDENGMYSFPLENPDKYDVIASKPGFRTAMILGVPIREKLVTKNDFYLPVLNNTQCSTLPVKEYYAYNCKRYMRNKTYRTKKERRLAKFD